MPWSQEVSGYVHSSGDHGKRGDMHIEVAVPPNVTVRRHELIETAGNGHHGHEGPWCDVENGTGRVCKVRARIWESGRHGFLGTGGNSWHGASLRVFGDIVVN